MSIIEPTGWSAHCDQCTEEWYPEDPVDGPDDCADYLRECGWIVLGRSTFCSLDCLLVSRSSRLGRRAITVECQSHARVLHSARYCCPRHGHHLPASAPRWMRCRKCRDLP